MAVLQHISDEGAQYERYISRQRFLMDLKTDREDLQEEKNRRLLAEQQAKEQKLLTEEQARLVEEQTQRADEIEEQNKVLLQKIEALKAKK